MIKTFKISTDYSQFYLYDPSLLEPFRHRTDADVEAGYTAGSRSIGIGVDGDGIEEIKVTLIVGVKADTPRFPIRKRYQLPIATSSKALCVSGLFGPGWTVSPVPSACVAEIFAGQTSYLIHLSPRS